jgi:hypothetical protein
MKVSRVCGRVATRPKMTITAVIVAVQSNMSNNRPQQMNATDQSYTKKAIQERAFWKTTKRGQALNTPAILEGLNEREREKAEKDQQANERERVKREREKQHFEAALNTYKRDRNNLKVVDLKALINRFRVEADPPIGQSKQQLSQQWSDIEHRLLDTMTMYNQEDVPIEAAISENQAFDNMTNYHDHNISI